MNDYEMMGYLGFDDIYGGGKTLLSRTKVIDKANPVTQKEQINTANIVEISTNNSPDIAKGLLILFLILIAMGFYGN